MPCKVPHRLLIPPRQYRYLHFRHPATPIPCRAPSPPLVHQLWTRSHSKGNGRNDSRGHGHHPHRTQRRKFSLSSIPTVLLPPVVFTGLLLTLWTYKCFMMVIFQNKIIYMPSMPPFSRSEKVEDYAKICNPVVWTEHSLRSSDGTELKILEGKLTAVTAGETVRDDSTRDATYAPQQIIVLYFQGNGSSLPPRLPYLSNVLKSSQSKTTAGTQYTFIALSYRGFWKSKGRPSQRGIELDAQAALQWVSSHYSSPHTNPHAKPKVIIWGQSIGAGVATTALATWQRQTQTQTKSQSSPPNPQATSSNTPKLQVSGLLLETPFTSLNAMLIALYPQKFLPYRYLGPFLMSTWNSVAALPEISGQLQAQELNVNNKIDTQTDVNTTTSKAHKNNEPDNSLKIEGDPNKTLKILLLEAENDELVPKGNAEELLSICKRSSGIDARHHVVSGALHTNVMMKSEGIREIVKFLRGFEET